ncbi:MAG: TolC family protein [Candidatus Omnitrophica bacterium]|nr:TolC family protein [Candidatus Omnitrophota bacterium]
MPRYLKILFILILSSFLFLNKSYADEVLTWHDCIKEAAVHQPDLIAAFQQVKQSEAGKDITASGLYPQINANLNASTGATTGAPTADTYTYGVSGSQLLFNAGKTINNVRAAKENVIAFKENYRFTSATVRFRLRSAFVNLLTNQENLRITREIYDIRRQNLELIALRYQSGLEHKGALLTAEADLAQAKYQISQAERQVDVARRDLLKEMGRVRLVTLSVNGDFEVKDKATEKPDFEVIAKNNPSLQQLIAQKKAAEFSLRAAYANFAPNLTAQTSAGRLGSHWSPNQNDWNMGLAVTLPLYEGGLRIAQVAQSKALLMQLQENERSSRDTVVSTLERSWADLQDAMQNVEVQRLNLIATQERSTIAQAQYAIGLISFDNWTIIEDNLVRAKSTYLGAQSLALLAEANWIQAKGETIEYE